MANILFEIIVISMKFRQNVYVFKGGDEFVNVIVNLFPLTAKQS